MALPFKKLEVCLACPTWSGSLPSAGLHLPWLHHWHPAIQENRANLVLWTHMLFPSFGTYHIMLLFNWDPFIYSISLQATHFPNLSLRFSTSCFPSSVASQCLVYILMIFYLFNQKLLSIEHYAIHCACCWVYRHFCPCRGTPITITALAYLHLCLPWTARGQGLDHNHLCILRTWQKEVLNKCVLNQLKLQCFEWWNFVTVKVTHNFQ